MKPITILVTALPMAHAAILSTRLIYQYPENNTWIENIAVRQDGTFLFTNLNSPPGTQGLYSLDPFAQHPTPQLVTNDFGGRIATLGIVETTPETFYLVANNFVGGNAIYRVAFSKGQVEPDVDLVTTLDSAVLLNGLTKLNDTLLLAADSFLGAVWVIDTETGAHHSFSDPLFAPAPNGTSVGVNGARFKDGYLYFTNSVQNIYGKVRLDATGKPLGPATRIAGLRPEKGHEVEPDDFALDHEGNAYVATMRGNSIQKISPSGHVELIAGGLNDTTIAVPSSAQFGRTHRDSDVLYVTTTGGNGKPVETKDGPVQFGAQIVAIDGVCER